MAYAHDSARTPTPHGPVTAAIAAMRQEPEPPRRRFLGAIAATPFFATSAFGESPSDLARACDWAVAHYAWINNPADDDRHWPDERLDVELDRYGAIISRALIEPSKSVGDLKAKVRLILCDFEDSLFPMKDEAENVQREAELDDCERLIRVVLKEVLALV